MAPPPAARALSLRSILPGLFIDALLPFLTYQLLTSYVPGLSQVTALAIGAIFPAVNGIVGIVRRRRLDVVAIIVLIGIAVSIVASRMGGDPKLFLIRESFVTGALGLVCLMSLAWPRPLMFYIGRQFTAGDDPAQIEIFNGLWQRPGARRVFRLLTIVWGAVWLGEFGLRVLMVWTLSVPQVLAISPFVFNGITIGLIAWTVAYVKRRRQRQADVDRALADQAAP
jgi:hypothetical protein